MRFGFAAFHHARIPHPRVIGDQLNANGCLGLLRGIVDAGERGERVNLAVQFEPDGGCRARAEAMLIDLPAD